MLAQRVQGTGHFEPALSSSLRANRLGYCKRLEQRFQRTIPRTTANRNHCQIEKADRDRFLVLQFSRQSDNPFIELLGAVEMTFHAIELRQCINCGGECALVAQLESEAQSLFQISSSFSQVSLPGPNSAEFAEHYRCPFLVRD